MIGLPVGRISIGDKAASCAPSVLHYGMASKVFVSQCSLHWEGVTVDHALVVFTIDAAFAFKKAVKTKWKCKNEASC